MVKFEQCAHHVTDKKKQDRKNGVAPPRRNRRNNDGGNGGTGPGRGEDSTAGGSSGSEQSPVRRGYNAASEGTYEVEPMKATAAYRKPPAKRSSGRGDETQAKEDRYMALMKAESKPASPKATPTKSPTASEDKVTQLWPRIASILFLPHPGLGWVWVEFLERVLSDLYA